MHDFSGGKGGDDTTNNVLIAQEAAVSDLINVVANGTDNPSDELPIASLSSHAVSFVKCQNPDSDFDFTSASAPRSDSAIAPWYGNGNTIGRGGIPLVRSLAMT